MIDTSPSQPSGPKASQEPSAAASPADPSATDSAANARQSPAAVPQSAPTALPSEPRPVVVTACLLVLALLFGWNAWKRDFWGPDETRLAEVTREMERSGDWLVPRLCGGEHLDNPPLPYWLGATFHRAVPCDPRLSYRLPVLVFAVLGLWLTYLGGKRLFDGRIGFLAMIIQGSSYLYFMRASWLDDDLLFAVSVQLAVTSFAIMTRKGSSPRWALAGWLGLAACALTKSLPLGLFLVAGTLSGFLYFEAGVGAMIRCLRRARRWPGLALFAVLVLPWYAVAAIQHGQAFLGSHVLEQHLRRLMGSPYDPQPPYYYLLSLAMGFLPWSIFVPLGLLHGKDRLNRDGERLGMFWSLFMLIALSLVSSKKPGYLLVVWPPFALLVAAALLETREWFGFWETYLRQGVFKGVPALMKVPLFAVLIFMGAYYGGLLDGISDPRVQGLLADRSSFTWGLALAVGASALVYARAERVRRLVRESAMGLAAFELASAAAFLFFAASFFYVGGNAIQSSRAVMEKFRAAIPEGTPVALYGRKEPEILYYLDPPQPYEHFAYPDPSVGGDPEYKRIDEFLRRAEEVFLVTSKVEFEGLEAQFSSLGPLLHLRESGRVGTRREYVLASNRKGE